jgi:hypothetical protein
MPGKKIAYILHPNAIVSTRPAPSLKGFLRQRIRWASKAGGYRGLFPILTTLIAFMGNLLILTTIVAAIAGLIPFLVPLRLFLIKMAADLPLLWIAMRFFRCPELIGWVLPVQLIYPLYIFIAGIISQLAPVRWK